MIIHCSNIENVKNKTSKMVFLRQTCVCSGTWVLICKKTHLFGFLGVGGRATCIKYWYTYFIGVILFCAEKVLLIWFNTSSGRWTC